MRALRILQIYFLKYILWYFVVYVCWTAAPHTARTLMMGRGQLLYCAAVESLSPVATSDEDLWFYGVRREWRRIQQPIEWVSLPPPRKHSPLALCHRIKSRGPSNECVERNYVLSISSFFSFKQNGLMIGWYGTLTSDLRWLLLSFVCLFGDVGRRGW